MLTLAVHLRPQNTAVDSPSLLTCPTGPIFAGTNARSESSGILLVTLDNLRHCALQY